MAASPVKRLAAAVSCADLARPGCPSRPNVREQLLAAVGETTDTGGRHGCGAVAPVPRDRPECYERDPGPHGFQRRQPAGVLDQDVARSHNAGHIVGPAEQVSTVTLGLCERLELLAEVGVVAASNDGDEPGLVRDELERLFHSPHAPRA